MDNNFNNSASISDCNLSDLNIDDAEFDIPQITEPPSLESILNSNEDFTDLFLNSGELQNDTNIQLLNSSGEKSEAASLSSQDNILSEKVEKNNKLENEHGYVLRHIVLKSISAQMRSAAERVDAGLPTCVTVSSIVVIGTSHGLVLLFDNKQSLKTTLGGSAVGEEFGAVSCLTLNSESDRLLCGYARGQILMWQIGGTVSKLLRSIVDAHPLGTAILQLKFTDDRTIALSSDSSGSVFRLDFKRMVGVRSCDFHCIFSGSRGEACVIEPLINFKSYNYEYQFKDQMLVAIASLSKVMVVSIKPQLKVHYVCKLLGDPATLPLLSWQLIIGLNSSIRTICPVLTFARDNDIYFLQLMNEGHDKIKSVIFEHITVPYKLLSLSWFNTSTILTIDLHEKAYVLDVVSQKVIQVVDLSSVQLVYSVSFYKSLATGGNVSPALAYAGEHACYQSIFAFNEQIILLGTKGMHVLTLRPWEDRIDGLIHRGLWTEGLLLGLSFYEGSAKAVVNLTKKESERKLIVGQKLVSLLKEFVQIVVLRGHGKNVQEAVIICIDICLLIDELDLLFDQIYDTFCQEPITKSIFLESLENYLAAGSMPNIRPAVMKDFVELLEIKQKFQSLEKSIVKVNVASLDIHQIVSLSWMYDLYDVAIYVYNEGMLDYASPLTRMLSNLSEQLSLNQQLDVKQTQLANKILLYINCCLSGLTYPKGIHNLEQSCEAKNQVFSILTQIHTINAKLGEQTYPHLRNLIDFNCHEFFNVLYLIFEIGKDLTKDEKQKFVDILLLIMVEGSGFLPDQVGMLFTFLARRLSRTNNDEIYVNRALFEQAAESLCSSTDDVESSRHEECQQSLLELISIGLEYLDERHLVQLASKAQFYRVLEYIHRLKLRFHLVPACYWNDLYRSKHVFKCIQDFQSDTELSLAEKKRIKTECLENISKLVSINTCKAAKLVVGCLQVQPTQIIEQLKNQPDILYLFLKGLFEYYNTTMNGPSTTSNFNSLSDIDPIIYSTFMELICEHDHSLALSFFKTFEGYELNNAIQCCKKHSAIEPLSYLYERAGDYGSAFNLIIDLSKKKYNSEEQDISSFNDPLNFLKRCSEKMRFEIRQASWFELIDYVIDSMCNNIQIEVKQKALDNILAASIVHLPLPNLLQKIITNKSYANGCFKDVKPLLMGMLSSCSYEETLLRTYGNLVQFDLHQELIRLAQVNMQAVTIRSNVCHLCAKLLSSDVKVYCFRCGHAYHASCLFENEEEEENSIIFDEINPFEEKILQKNVKNRLCLLCHGVPSKSVKYDADIIETHSYSTCDNNSFNAWQNSQKTDSQFLVLQQLKNNSPKRKLQQGIFNKELLTLKVVAPLPP